jgi:hypothetical protein
MLVLLAIFGCCCGKTYIQTGGKNCPALFEKIGKLNERAR